MILNPGKAEQLPAKRKGLRHSCDICVQSLPHILAVEIFGCVRLRARIVPHRHLHKIELRKKKETEMSWKREITETATHCSTEVQVVLTRPLLVTNDELKSGYPSSHRSVYKL